MRIQPKDVIPAVKGYGPVALWKALRFRDRAVIVVLSVVLSGALAFWVGAAFSAVTREVPAHGGRYVEGVVGQPRYVNPVLSSVNAADEDLVSVVYEGLTGYDRDGRIVSRLAEKIDVSDDGMTYVVTIRDGAVWHDGEPVTAEDVAFTVETIKDPAYRSPIRQKWQGVDVEVRDARTVVFILKKAYFGFPDHLTVGILPKHIWETVAPERFALADANLAPIGSGPYRFAGFQKDSEGNILSCELRAFPGYVGGEAHIDRITFSFYPDEDSMVEAYGRREIIGMSPLSAERGVALSARKGTIVHDFSVPRVFSVFFNTTKSVPLAYSEVRQALSMATDREALVRDALSGRGTAATVPFLSFMEGDPSVPSVAFDADAASRLLEEKGWKAGDDGIRHKGDDRLAFDLKVPDWPELRRTADLLREQWKALGVDVTVDVMPVSELNRDVIRPREYEALLYGEEMGVNPDFYSFWHSSEKNDPGLNLALFDDSDADDLLLKLREESDPGKRDELLGAFLGILSEKNPAVFLFSPDVSYVMSDGVKGVDIRTVNGVSSRFSTVRDWYMDTKRVFRN
ncbi:MAG: peptide ABC transporter substrate-binding protein [Candidatus Moranbacteria bacterium]|nr:peptide ABC transporter substrate-binding protein [Candidatus Moranbacteria bacterium]